MSAMGNARHANGGRRRSLRQRVLRIYTHCALCRGEVDKSLPPDDDWAPEVDEIVPLSMGGSPYRWDNVQLTHRICNRLKGNGTTPATNTSTQPITSRVW